MSSGDRESSKAWMVRVLNHGPLGGQCSGRGVPGTRECRDVMHYQIVLRERLLYRFLSPVLASPSPGRGNVRSKIWLRGRDELADRLPHLRSSRPRGNHQGKGKTLNLRVIRSWEQFFQ